MTSAVNGAETSFEETGAAAVEGILTEQEVLDLRKYVGREFPNAAGTRNILRDPRIRMLADDARVRALVQPHLGSSARPVRGILFDKTSGANWSVPWHQDLTISVAERVDIAGFGPWSVKAGVVHVQPPADVLEAMMTVRLHLDPCGEDNGPLKVVEWSHRYGKISEREIDSYVSAGTVRTLAVGSGGVVLMRPLTLHSSSPAQSPSHRRVVHIEFASGELPHPLRWFEQ
jgi:hypothetical protein